MEAVKNIDLTILEYSHSAETKARTKLSASYIKQGVSVNKEDIYHYRWIKSVNVCNGRHYGPR
jgi:hypothetical protein